MKVTAIAMVAAASVSLAACGGHDDGAKTAGKAMSASASATPSPSSDLLFTKGKINKNDFSSALISSVKKMTMYHMDGSTNFAESGEKHTIKLSSDYDGRDQAKPKAHMLMSEPSEGKKVEVVVIGKDIYKKSGSKWVKSPHSGDGMGLADIAETLRTSSKAIDSVTYVGQEPRGHRFDVVLDPAKLGGGKTAAARKESVKATYWLDDSKRVVGMKLDASVDGRSAAMDVSMSKFGEPVNIPKVS